MRAKLIILAAVIMALAIPSVASAYSLLSMKEGRAGIGRSIQKSDTGYQRGSLVLYCSRQSPLRIRCDVLFTDDYGDDWCGSGKAILNPRTNMIHSFTSTNRIGCESF